MFGVRILDNDPRTTVLAAGWHTDERTAQESGNAFSDTFGTGPPGREEADQGFAPLELGHMRGVLLAVLGREEYAERVGTDAHDEGLREGRGAPAQAAVRITDLRLAADPVLEDQASLKVALRPLLDRLERPLTTNGVLQWKWDLLCRGEGAKIGGQ